MVNWDLELEAHEDIVDLRGGLTRQGLQFGKLFGLEIVQLYVIIEFP